MKSLMLAAALCRTSALTAIAGEMHRGGAVPQPSPLMSPPDALGHGAGLKIDDATAGHLSDDLAVSDAAIEAADDALNPAELS
jgi:hypothetical protein